MTKFTDAQVTTLKAKFEAGDRPTEANFADLIDATQQGIEEHDHAGVGDGDSALLGSSQIIDRVTRFFVPAEAGYNVTDASAIAVSWTPELGVPLPDSKNATAYGQFRCPTNYASAMTAKVVIVSASAGDVYASTHASGYGADGESKTQHSDLNATGAITIAANTRNEEDSLSLASMATGDTCKLAWTRDATNASDTVSDTVVVAGWVITYTADR